MAPSSSNILNVIGLESASLLPIKNKNEQNKTGQSGTARYKDLMTVLPVFWFFFSIVLILIAWWARAGLDLEPRLLQKRCGEQMEIDIRLPYKGFKEIHPLLKYREPRVQGASDEKCVQAFGEFREEQANGQVDNYRFVKSQDG